MHVLHMSWTGSNPIWDLVEQEQLKAPHLQDQPQPLLQQIVHLQAGLEIAIVMITSILKFVAGMVETVVVMMLAPSTALNANALILVFPLPQQLLQLLLLLQLLQPQPPS